MKKALNILYDLRPLQTDSAYRGVGVYTRNLLLALSRIDTENRYHLLYYSHLPKPSFIIADGFKTAEFPVKGMGGSFTRFNALYDCAFLPKAIEKLSPDVIHFTNPLEMNQFSSAGVLNSRSVATFYDLTPVRFRDKIFTGKRALLWPLFKMAMNSYRDMGHIICISENSGKDLLNYFPSLNPSSVTAIPLALPDETLKIDDEDAPLSPSLEETCRGGFILYVGALAFNKNMDIMPPVLNKVKKLMGRGIPLIIAGKVHPSEEARFMAEADKNGVADLIAFTGFISRKQILELYRKCSLSVFPSLYEGFGLPALEAMSAGSPLLCADSSSLPEVVGDGGILIDPRLIDDWVREICRVLEDEDLREAMRKKGIERSRCFSWKKNAEATLEIYQKL